MSVKCPRTITIGELKKELAMFPDDAEIDFGSTMSGNTLCFYRTKDRGAGTVQIELNEYNDIDLKPSG